MDYRHDEWGVDVAIAGSQKGLMLPPGLGFNAVSEKALAAAKIGADAEVLLGLAGHARSKQDRILSLYAGHQPAVWFARVAQHAATKKGCRMYSSAIPGMAKQLAAPCVLGDWKRCVPIQNATAVP